ncbi:long-chain-fatty-acid--CoA ligase [Nocardia wallacei]|uniref:long-chain-fatty-acid--CoA ligase n=1 Tax=Nocardia wallacei TaxID=480035 RepID=UPI0024558C09|nr:long-chain fatty acid--CoA ligase [Nocardia wallacei]
MSVAAVLAETASRAGEDTALVCGDARVSYRALWARAMRFAERLRARGLGRGDRVALLLTNTPAFPVAYFGILAAGATVVPVNILLRTEEIAYLLRDCAAAALVSEPALRPSAEDAGGAAGVEIIEFAQTPEIDEPKCGTAADYVRTDGDEVAVVLYTSGTSGHPKGVLLTHANLVTNVTVTMLSPFAFGPADVLLGALPLHHTFGQICGMCVCFRAGATLVLMPRFDAAHALELLAAERCTVFMGVPTMYFALLDAAGAGVESALDRAYCGGAPLSPQTLLRFRSVFGCEIYEGYGLTETSPVVAYNAPGAPVKPGTVGRAIWGVRVEIARSDLDGRIELLPDGEVGEIVVRGHNVMAGYLNRPDATAEVLVDGWFRSGDLGRKDEDGYLVVVDRKKDMILRGGYNVYPRELEDVLIDHPRIAQVAVIGVPDERLGQEVCAVVIARGGAAAAGQAADEIVAWSRNRLAAYKYPRRVVFVDEFPLGPSGKVLKRELAARIG